MGKKEGMKRNGNKNGISNEKGYDKKKSAMGIMRIGGILKWKGMGVDGGRLE